MHVGIASGLARLCRQRSCEAHAFVGAHAGHGTILCAGTEIIKCSGIQVGKVDCLLQIAILRGRRLRLAGKLCEGGRGASRLASGCFLQARCPSREPSETGLPLFVGRAEYMDIWELGVVNTNTLLHVKIEGYRGTDPPSRNLEFRERWKIGGFLVRL